MTDKVIDNDNRYERYQIFLYFSTIKLIYDFPPTEF